MDRKKAIELLDVEIEVFRKSPDDFKRGYLLGLLSAFSHVCFINDDLNDHYFNLISDIG